MHQPNCNINKRSRDTTGTGAAAAQLWICGCINHINTQGLECRNQLHFLQEMLTDAQFTAVLNEQEGEETISQMVDQDMFNPNDNLLRWWWS